jgi:hypothetical protein
MSGSINVNKSTKQLIALDAISRPTKEGADNIARTMRTNSRGEEGRFKITLCFRDQFLSNKRKHRMSKRLGAHIHALQSQQELPNRRPRDLTLDNRGKHAGCIICPNCSTQMHEIRRYDADIDYCPSCKGVWLDRGEIDKIALAQNRIDKEHYQRYHRDRDYDDYDDDYYRYGGHRRRRGFLGDLFDFD